MRFNGKILGILRRSARSEGTDPDLTTSSPEITEVSDPALDLKSTSRPPVKDPVSKIDNSCFPPHSPSVYWRTLFENGKPALTKTHSGPRPSPIDPLSRTDAKGSL